MNLKLLLLTIVVAAPLHGAGDYLLKATSITNEGQRWIATDGAVLSSKNGETRITADKIVFEQPGAVFRLTGHVVIQSGGTIVETSEATLKTEGQKVFFLSKGEITLASGQSFDPKSGSPELPAFGEPFPKTETKLTAPRGASIRFIPARGTEVP
jgi:hypothetical protein